MAVARYNFEAALDFQPGYAIGDLRNGALATITEVIPRGAIPEAYYWTAIGGLPPAQRLQRMQVLIRMHYALIRVRDPQMPAATAKNQAIILGSIRTGASIAYALGADDISRDEMAPGIANYRAPRPAVAEQGQAGQAGYVAAADAVTEGLDFQWNEGTRAAAGAAWTEFVALTPLELEVATFHVPLGMAILPGNGWSIVKCGHHFYSNPALNMRALWDALKRQWSGKIPTSVASWVAAAAAFWEDMAFHKALHPVLMALAVQMAKDMELPPKLKQAGWGSVAIRLPAHPPDYEYAKMVLALVGKSRPVLIAMGGDVNPDALNAAMAAVEAAANDQDRALRIQAAVAIAHGGDAAVAYMAGVYEAVTNAAGGARPTLFRSVGLNRTMGNEPAYVHQGMQEYRAHAQRRRDAMLAGTATAPTFIF